MAAKNGNLVLTFVEERETKGTFRFQEKVESDLDEPKIGTLYVRKATLRDLGWNHGELHLTVAA